MQCSTRLLDGARGCLDEEHEGTPTTTTERAASRSRRCADCIGDQGNIIRSSCLGWATGCRPRPGWKNVRRICSGAQSTCSAECPSTVSVVLRQPDGERTDEVFLAGGVRRAQVHRRAPPSFAPEFAKLPSPGNRSIFGDWTARTCQDCGHWSEHRQHGL